MSTHTLLRIRLDIDRRMLNIDCAIPLLVLLLTLTNGIRLVSIKSGPASAWIWHQSGEAKERMHAFCPPLPTHSNYMQMTLSKSHYEPPSLRIIGGEPAQRGMYPYAAALTADLPSRFVHCGATLISRRHLITAAHCTNRVRKRLFVLVDGPCIQYNTEDACDSPADVMQEVEIDFVLTHYHDFSFRDGNKSFLL